VDDRLYAGAVHSLLNVIHGLGDKPERVMLFGHNPELTGFAHRHSRESRLSACQVWASNSISFRRASVGFWAMRNLHWKEGPPSPPATDWSDDDYDVDTTRIAHRRMATRRRARPRWRCSREELAAGLSRAIFTSARVKHRTDDDSQNSVSMDRSGRAMLLASSPAGARPQASAGFVRVRD
jgi:hypothetical protein